MVTNQPKTSSGQQPAQQVQVKRTEIPSPTLDNPKRVTIQVQYQLGSLPPRFLYFDKDQWTKEREAAAIKADILKTMAPPGEMVTL